MKIILLFALSWAQASIFGTDDRTSVLAGSFLANAEGAAVAMMVPNNFVTDSARGSGLKDLEIFPLTETWGLCSSERFAATSGFFVGCTGFLIAPDILMTAGHCAVNHGESTNEANAFCENFSWLFDFQVGPSGRPQVAGVVSDNLYQCEKVIKAVHDSEVDAAGKLIFRSDYALIKLKRKTARQPLTLAKALPQKGERLSVIGHPLGMPMVRSAGKVLTQNGLYFNTNLDIANGNSGSPVLNSKNEVTGILVRGYPESFVMRPAGDCRLMNRCSEDGTRCDQDQKLTTPGAHVHGILSIPELASALSQK
ncbi:MAG: trypsin-like serine peptidase [Bdellovibrio sp.]|jgi:V8-like Glu-specific endopeptidase